jgi:hypothetical protein
MPASCSPPTAVLEALAQRILFISGKPYKLKHGERVIAGCKNSLGYRQIGISYGGKNYLVLGHHLFWFIVYGCRPTLFIDHKNRDRDFNTVDNLRQVTNAENLQNRKVSSVSKTGIKGVCPHPYGFKASITLNGVEHQRYFKNIDDAEVWRKAQSKILHPFNFE